MLELRKITLFMVFIVLLLFIYNPYTVIGNLGVFVALPIALYGGAAISFKGVNIKVIFPFLMLLISSYAVFVSWTYEIFQLNHLRVTLNIFIYVLFSIGIFRICCENKISFLDIVFLLFLSCFLNSAIVLIQVLSPSVRIAIESLLLPSGNVNWVEGFRYRGIASGGGASLSILIPTSLVLALHLYREKYVSWLFLLPMVVILVVSLFFIGRTGVVLIPVVIFIYLLFNGVRYLGQFFLLCLVLTFTSILLFEHIKTFMIEMYGEGFFNYAFGFLLDGSEGIENEGTVGVIIGFLSVIPTTFPEVVSGVGFYGGSEFYPWTDSGYARMFLSVGFVFGVIYYISFLLMFSKSFKIIPFISMSILAILIISEVKEPLLLTGYASRLFIFLMTIAYLYEERRKANNNFRGCSV
ncbi:hypothetical protein [Vibrio chagasii]|uniref:hypothetical protein n=1 Tax=Vibrio chagasii TaxID=170679 RepID=UPI00406798C0